LDTFAGSSYARMYKQKPRMDKHGNLHAMQDCSKSPNQLSIEKSTASIMEQQAEDLQKLRDRVSVLAHSKETDGRRFRQIAVERQREREDLKREVDRLKVWLPGLLCLLLCHLYLLNFASTLPRFMLSNTVQCMHWICISNRCMDHKHSM